MKAMKYKPASREITTPLHTLIVLDLFYFHFQYVQQLPSPSERDWNFCLSSGKAKINHVYHVNPVKCLLFTPETVEFFQFSLVELVD